MQELNDQRRAADEAAPAPAPVTNLAPSPALAGPEVDNAFQNAARPEDVEAAHGVPGGVGGAGGADLEAGDVEKAERAGAEEESGGVRLDGAAGHGAGGSELLQDPSLEALLQQHGLAHLRAALEAHEILDLPTVAELSESDWVEMGLEVAAVAPLIVAARGALARGGGGDGDDDGGVGAASVGGVLEEGGTTETSSVIDSPLIDFSDDGGVPPSSESERSPALGQSDLQVAGTGVGVEEVAGGGGPGWVTFENETGDGDVEAGGGRLGDGDGVKLEEGGAHAGAGGGQREGSDEARDGGGGERPGELQAGAAEEIGLGGSGACAEEAERSTSLSREEGRTEGEDQG
jgi:hypothetical protein